MLSFDMQGSMQAMADDESEWYYLESVEIVKSIPSLFELLHMRTARCRYQFQP